MWSLLSWIELPLLRRELLEASHKRRTYALRTVIAVIHVVGFLLYYFSVYSRRGSIRQFSGEGVDAVYIQIMIDIFAVVLLLPAMACSAIAGEREKQTLGLLLISRIRPFALVIEKLLSRLPPMSTLLLITVPMLGVAFLLGGVELGDVLLILCLQWWSFPEVIGLRIRAEEVCLITDAGVLLTGLMMIAGVGCRTFAAERSRETLDILLTTPIRNRDLLNQKLSGVNRIRWYILGGVLITGLVHLFVVDMTYLYGRYPVRWRTPYDYILNHSRNHAWGYLPLNFVFSLLHAFVYLTIMKWAAVGFSLIFRTQMKAMMATLVAAIGLCALPFVGAMIPLVLQSIVPKQFPAFLFSSPLIIWGLNETGELRDLVPASSFLGVMEGKWTAFHHDPELSVFKRNGMSQGKLVSINLLIYGTMALVLKYGILLLLPRILGRRDADVS